MVMRSMRDALADVLLRHVLCAAREHARAPVAGARKEVSDLGFEDTYLIQQYVVRGDDCQIIKAFPYPNWVVYTSTDDGKKVMLGEQATRPTYQDIEALLEAKGVSAKWAREAGLGKAFKE
eukprot:3933993-Rhodomonas_salina.5